MLALIRAALEGLAAIPKILNLIVSLGIESRIQKLEKNQERLSEAYDLLQKAKTTEEKANAADALARAWRAR